MVWKVLGLPQNPGITSTLGLVLFSSSEDISGFLLSVGKLWSSYSLCPKGNCSEFLNSALDQVLSAKKKKPDLREVMIPVNPAFSVPVDIR